LGSQFANFGVQLASLLLMRSFQFRCTALFLKETWQPLQGDGSPCLELRRMDFVGELVVNNGVISFS
jgi:hypothetical protein